MGALALALGCNLLKPLQPAVHQRVKRQQKKQLVITPAANAQNSKSAAPVPKPDIAGKYNITGINPDGAAYKAQWSDHAATSISLWDAGSQYDGVGVQNGNIIAVAFTTGKQQRLRCGRLRYSGDGTRGMGLLRHKRNGRK